MNEEDTIFELIVEETRPKRAAQRSSRDWAELGLDFYKKQLKTGITAKAFSSALGIPYGTFTKSMSRYRKEVEFAIQIDRIRNTPAHKLKRADREKQMINDFRESLKRNGKSVSTSAKNKSSKWFAKTIADGVKSHKANKPSPGKLFTFVYDAKHKDKLEVWDKFPLIIFLGSGMQGSSYLMYGLNLHYLPAKARVQFLEELLKMHASTPRLSNNTRLKINWSKVKSMRGSDLMIKAYLPSHVKGTFLEINPKDWHNVVLLPTQKFIGKDGKSYATSKVWGKY